MYPTAEQILAAPRRRYKPGTLTFVRRWKRENRGHRRTPDAIKQLLEGLGVIYQKPVQVLFSAGADDHYNPAASTIVLNADRLSVVTALHEFGHHLYGVSELKACRWSIHLFRRTFRRTFERATFDRHVLVVPTTRAREAATLRTIRVVEDVDAMRDAIANTLRGTGVTSVRFVDEETGETRTVIPVAD